MALTSGNKLGPYEILSRVGAGGMGEVYRARDMRLERLQHYWSRARTPKDNAVCERFNRTLQEEFLSLGNMVTDTGEFNRRLTEWLVEYNFRRPHQALNYLPPISFIFKYHKVLPMYPSSTIC